MDNFQTQHFGGPFTDISMIQPYIGKTIITTLPSLGRIRAYVVGYDPFTQTVRLIIETPVGQQLIIVPISDFSGIQLVSTGVIVPVIPYGPSFIPGPGFTHYPWFPGGMHGGPGGMHGGPGGMHGGPGGMHGGPGGMHGGPGGMHGGPGHGHGGRD